MAVKVGRGEIEGGAGVTLDRLAAVVLGFCEVAESYAMTVSCQNVFWVKDGEVRLWNGVGTFAGRPITSGFSPTTDANQAFQLAERVKADQIQFGRLKGGWSVTVILPDVIEEFSAMGRTQSEALTRAALLAAAELRMGIELEGE